MKLLNKKYDYSCNRISGKETDYININNQRQRNSITILILVLFLFLSVFNKFTYGIGLSGVIIPIIIFLFIIILERKNLVFSRNHALFLLYCIFAVLSTIISKVITPQRDVISFLIFVLFYIVSTAISYKEADIKIIFKSYIVISLLVSLNIIWNYANNSAYSWNRYSLHIFGIYRDPNYVSAFVIPAVALIVYSLIYIKKIDLKKIAYNVIVLFFIMTGLLLTGSRTPFLLLGLIILINISYLLLKRRRKLTRNIFLIFSMFLITWLIFINFVPQFIYLRLTNFELYSNDIRVIIWIKMINLFLIHPILGAGLGASNYYSLQFFGLNTHNVYLDIIMGQGLIGIILLCLIISRYILAYKNDRFLMLLLVISFFTPLFFINGLNTTTFWTPIILCQILSDYSRKSNGKLNEVL